MNNEIPIDGALRRIALSVATGILMMTAVFLWEAALTLVPQATRIRFFTNAPFASLLVLYALVGAIFGLLITPLVRRRPGEPLSRFLAACALGLGVGYLIFWLWNEPHFPSIRRTKLLLPDLTAIGVALGLALLGRRIFSRGVARTLVAIIVVLGIALPLAQWRFHQDDAQGALIPVSEGAFRPNVVLITIDTLRARSIGAYGYSRASTPVIDRLAAEGLRFENAYTPVPQTGPSHATILTGLHPAHHGVLYNGWILSDRFLTIAEILKANGYETFGAVSVEHITTPFGFGQGIETFVDHNSLFDRFYSVGPNSGAEFSLVKMLRTPKLRHHEARWFNPGSHQRSGDRTMDIILDVLEKRGTGPFFLWLHLFDPHKPYSAPAAYVDRFRKIDVELPDTPFPVEETRERFDQYDAEVAFVDDQMGRLLRALGPSLDETLIIFTADHGESLGEHGYTGHSSRVTEEVAKVPLIMHMPGRIPAGRIEHRRVDTLDIAPTILSFLNLPIPEQMSGGNLLHPASAGPLYFQCESPSGFRLYGVLAGDLKVVFTWPAGADRDDWSAARQEAYDIGKDAGEEVNLIGRDEGKALAAAIRALGEDTRAFYGNLDVPMQAIDPATKEALEALGYVQ